MHCDQENYNLVICGEFLGYVPLKKLHAKSISEAILQFLKNCNSDLNKFVGQGYDHCSLTADNVSRVQTIISDKCLIEFFSIN